jgi:hypothetical protein
MVINMIIIPFDGDRKLKLFLIFNEIAIFFSARWLWHLCTESGYAEEVSKHEKNGPDFESGPAGGEAVRM